MEFDKLLLEHGIICISGEINERLALNICKEIILISRSKKISCINILISSQGGDVDAALLILECMQSCRLQVNTFCLSKAYDAAALIFVSGAVRYMEKNSELIINCPFFPNSDFINVKIFNETLAKTDPIIKRIISYSASLEINNKVVFSAKEALEYGLCEGIGGIEKLINL